jgi:type III pantothenate kinase
MTTQQSPLILCLDVGNTTVFGGVFSSDGSLVQTFRYTTKTRMSSDEYGIFLRSVLRENGIEPKLIETVAIASVVPDTVHSLSGCALKYFGKEPFVLRPGTKTGLKIRYRNPLEVGADRIANAIAAVQRYPNRDMIIIDFGTATTFDVVTKEKDYLGGIILPGVATSMEVLEERTAKLPRVEIVRPEDVVGRSTVESIQSGLFFGTVEMIAGLTKRITESAFPGSQPHVIGTGGFARLFEKEGIFNETLPDLVLQGIFVACMQNRE